MTGTGIPAGAFVGKVINTPVMATAPSQNGGFVVAGSFTLVNAAGPAAADDGGRSTESRVGPRTPATDPLFNATAPTNGGGDTGSVLISPYIKPGSVSKRFYNHYSWLRTMEDLFGVASVSRGLDHAGPPRLRGPAAVWRHSDQMCSTTRLGRRTAPAPTPDIGRIVQASLGDPRLAIQGDTVAVALGSGRGRATAVGPAVAARGLSPRRRPPSGARSR